MVLGNTHHTSLSTDSTLSPDTPKTRPDSNSSTSTLNAHNYFSSYHFIQSGTTKSPATSSNTSYPSCPGTDQTSSCNTTLPTLATPTITNEKELERLHTTFTRTESTYDPAEFNYSTPPGQSKSLYRRLKDLFKTFHIIRHWPKYERKLERKLFYLHEDATYWKGEVEERERMQEDRLKRQKEMREEKWRRERSVWGASGETNGRTMVGAC